MSLVLTPHWFCEKRERNVLAEEQRWIFEIEALRKFDDNALIREMGARFPLTVLTLLRLNFLVGDESPEVWTLWTE